MLPLPLSSARRNPRRAQFGRAAEALSRRRLRCCVVVGLCEHLVDVERRRVVLALVDQVSVMKEDPVALVAALVLVCCARSRGTRNWISIRASAPRSRGHQPLGGCVGSSPREPGFVWRHRAPRWLLRGVHGGAAATAAAAYARGRRGRGAEAAVEPPSRVGLFRRRWQSDDHVRRRGGARAAARRRDLSRRRRRRA